MPRVVDGQDRAGDDRVRSMTRRSVVAHLFKCAGSSSYGLSRDRSGSNLPVSRQGAWSYVRDVELVPGEQRTAMDSDAAIADLETHGFHLVGAWYASH